VGTEDVFNGQASRAARRCCPPDLWRIARRKLDQIDSAIRLEDLRVPPGNRLELLRGDRSGQCSIRINSRYRICFVWTFAGPERVEIVDYH
jgi:proteic killer suppression protein